MILHDRIDRLHACVIDHAKSSVLAIKAQRDVLGRGKRDEEGRLGTVVDTGTCHGHGTTLEIVGKGILDIVLIELADDGWQRRIISRRAIALRSALQTEALDDAIELEPIVIAVLGKIAEVRDCHGSRIGIELDGERIVALDLDDGVMRTGKQTIYNDDLEENQIWYFQTKGSLKGQGYHGERDNQVYVNGLLKKADPELRYEPVSTGEKRYLVNTSGTIQKATSSSSSASRPELGKGFKDIKDSNDTVWTVDTSGIIQ